MATSTIGQPDAGVVSDARYTVVGGFWGGSEAVRPPGLSPPANLEARRRGAALVD